MATLLRLVCLLAFFTAVLSDCYMHNPRGSNNRLNERSANRANANRLFDSQVSALHGGRVLAISLTLRWRGGTRGVAWLLRVSRFGPCHRYRCRVSLFAEAVAGSLSNMSPLILSPPPPPPTPQNNNRGGYNAGDIKENSGFNSESEIYYMVKQTIMATFWHLVFHATLTCPAELDAPTPLPLGPPTISPF